MPPGLLIRKRTLTSQVVDYILDLMKSGRVKPGDKLPTEDALTSTLGVSRTCVREAVKSLESLDLISVRPRVGAVVKEPSASAMFRAEHLLTAAYREQRDVLIEFREILEVGLASLAAEKRTPDDITAMERAVADHQQAIEESQLAYQADIDFHSAIAAATKNAIAIMVFQSILEPLTEQRRNMNAVPNAAEEGLRDHRRILAAIKAGNAKRARAAMRAHMETASRYSTLAKTAIKRTKGRSTAAG